ncbi:MAG: redoxin domain-containing protein [Candidatus Eremiobacteraeota bacterium]|nr:redoxin domain-containing protein [Candidatus Eremiobacteraeota bacterium]
MRLRIAAASAALWIALLTAGTALRATADQPDVAKGFEGASAWLNGGPPTATNLQGKVVLVDFWEYTCINCLRTLPYLREWYRRYKDDGLVILGIHTPEFAFSGEQQNVAAAAQHLGVTWPIALDDNHTIWDRFHTDRWPTELLFDSGAHLVDRTVGEGDYRKTEKAIQTALLAMNPKLHMPPVMELLPQDSYDKPGAVCYLQTPETYVGPWHGTQIANAPSPALGETSGMGADNYYADPGRNYQDGAIYLQGSWTPSKDGQAMVDQGGGYLTMRYHAIEVMTVMRPQSGSVRVGVTQDGKPIPKDDAGADVKYDASGNSYVDVDQARAYHIVENAKFGTHDLRLTPSGNGLGIYSFAFESCEKPASG